MSGRSNCWTCRICKYHAWPTTPRYRNHQPSGRIMHARRQYEILQHRVGQELVRLSTLHLQASTHTAKAKNAEGYAKLISLAWSQHVIHAHVLSFHALPFMPVHSPQISAFPRYRSRNRCSGAEPDDPEILGCHACFKYIIHAYLFCMTDWMHRVRKSLRHECNGIANTSRHRSAPRRLGLFGYFAQCYGNSPNDPFKIVW